MLHAVIKLFLDYSVLKIYTNCSSLIGNLQFTAWEVSSFLLKNYSLEIVLNKELTKSVIWWLDYVVKYLFS